MKKRESCWKRFEQTGDIRDYLNYTACTREETAVGCSVAVQDVSNKTLADVKKCAETAMLSLKA